MPRAYSLLCAVCLFPAALVAQPPDSLPATGRIKGDVYWVTPAGEVRQGAGLSIALVTPNPAIGQALASLCEAQGTAIVAFMDSAKVRTPKDSATRQTYATWTVAAVSVISSQQVEERGALLYRMATRTASTGMRAHYVFDAVPAGRYLVFASWRLAGELHQWLQQVDVAPGVQITLDLDKERSMRGPLACPESRRP